MAPWGKLHTQNEPSLTWPLCAEPEPESSDRRERPGCSARGRSVHKARPVSVLGSRPDLMWTVLASVRLDCSASGHILFLLRRLNFL